MIRKIRFFLGKAKKTSTIMRYFSPNLEVKKKLVGLILLLLIDVLWEGKWHIFVHDWFTPTLLFAGTEAELLLLLTQCLKLSKKSSIICNSKAIMLQVDGSLYWLY